MRPQWLWDKNISEEEIKIILKDPEHERFMNLAALLLSRNNAPKEIFDQYLDKKLFVQNWSRIKRRMRKDSWNDPRIVFWQAVYEKLRDEFKEKGMVIRARPAEITGGNVSWQIAEKIKTARQDLRLTQGELAEKIGISQQIISRIEKGRNDLRLSTLEKVLRFLGEQVEIKSGPAFYLGKFSNGQKEVAHA